MSNTPAHRFPPFQTVIWASLSVVGGFSLLMWIRPMSPKELALSLLCGVGAFIVFGVAVLAELIEPTLVEIRLRLRQLELHQQLTIDHANVMHLRGALRQIMRDPRRASEFPSDHAEGPLNAYLLPDPDEPEEALPVGADTRSLST